MWAVVCISLAMAGKPEFNTLVASPDGQRVAALGTLDGKGYVALYDAGSGAELGGTALPLSGAPETAGFSKDGSQVVVFGADTAFAVGTTTFAVAESVALEFTPRSVALVDPWKLQAAGLYRKLLTFDVAGRKATHVPITDPSGMQAMEVVVDAAGATWVTLEDARGLYKSLCRLDTPGVCGPRLPLATALIGLHPRADGSVGGVRQASAAECTLASFRVTGTEIVAESLGPVPSCASFAAGAGGHLTHSADVLSVQPAAGSPVEAAPSGLSGVRDAIFAGEAIAATDGKKVLFFDPATLDRKR